ncbi:MAG: MjaI family restriction endonuclease [Lentisphaeria bacterium]|nr:MjaI family restriction endonuclease [Lentisphaeria bacterium]
MGFLIKKEVLAAINETVIFAPPKYTAQLINLANRNARATCPDAIGQLSELFQEFMASSSDVTVEAWKNWYIQRHPGSLNEAAEKICTQLKNLQEAIELIDEGLVKDWVEDLVITKTFNGLYVQKAILTTLATRLNASFRLATPDEESLGIDGYVGDTPYSIKPETYKTMKHLNETIKAKMIYYKKTSKGLIFEIEE